MKSERNTDVILINLPVDSGIKSDDIGTKHYIPPMGLMFLSVSLELNGYSALIIDFAAQPFSNQNLVDIIKCEQPILVGISTYTANFNAALNLTKIIKLSCPNIHIVLGGPHVSLVPEDGMRCKYVDFIVIREGEATIVELAEAISTNQATITYYNIKGLCYRSANSSIKNGNRSLIKDLDILPIVKRDFAIFDVENKFINVVTSRGCPGRCLYCAATVLSGPKYRTRDIDSVFMEIIQLKTIFHKQFSIFFVDDTFTVARERVLRFAELINFYAINLTWWCDSRVDAMSEELLAVMAQNGCVNIAYGIESGNQHVLNSINKKIELGMARKIIEYTKNAGIQVTLNFMLGHFCDTKDTMHDTINFIKEMYFSYDANILLTYNTPFPGTWQYQKREQLGIKMPDNYDQFILTEPIIETQNFTISDQLEAGLKVAPFIKALED